MHSGAGPARQETAPVEPRLPRLYAIVDVDACARAGREPRDIARAYLAGGARLLQLRAKGLGSGPFLDLAARIAEDAASAGAHLIVNDRADLAVLARAHGVHVGQDDLAPSDARRLVGPEAIVGLSTHTDGQLEAGFAEPVTYLAVGPLFGTQTKDTGYEPLGLERLRAAARAAAGRLPLVAIGGITLDTAPAVIEAGAASVAVIGDLLAGEPEARVRAWTAALR